ncbi:MAG: hypothetical protein AB7P49_19860, partial [Bdellovibrionales bacterium]
MELFDQVLHHVHDANDWEFISHHLAGGDGVVWKLPAIPILGYSFQITKFMILEVLAAILIVLIYVPMARKVAAGDAPTGPWWNAFESLLTFIRNNVARPALRDPHASVTHSHAPAHGEPVHGDDHGHHHGHGHHPTPEEADRDVDRYVPFLWTIFLFILFCNLLG